MVDTGRAFSAVEFSLKIEHCIFFQIISLVFKSLGGWFYPPFCLKFGKIALFKERR
jgi:hypothetical protein